ncbi:preprotein translocase subunit SecA [bacterium]|nr:preprotein translocase subunit SecA [bacterium]
MVLALAKKIFGSSNDRIVRNMRADVARINALEPEFEKLSDEQLKGKTAEFRARLEKGEHLDDLLPEAFATVREAAKRVYGMRHFDVQLIGGMVLHRGQISEMKTGEGKTLVCTLPAYLNALPGKGVHVVTVNDYLAKRDAEWMGGIYNFLGMSVGCIVHGLDDAMRKHEYACDITYGTNNEYGFDYLRDNMKYDLEDMVQRPFHFAVVDEVDSILVDEARTPLIISGPTEDNSELYVKVDAVIPKLKEGDFEVDLKHRSVTLTEEGSAHIEELLKKTGMIDPESNLYDLENVTVVHHVNQSLRAHKLFSRDVDYIVKDNKVIIIDEFTGRMMEGRRYSEGLHQALEAKEKAKIQNENQTLASITFQNYFRMYPKLAGMTGTAMTEAAEFMDIYKLPVVEIPTNVPVKRADFDDEIYRTAKEKYDAIISAIEDCHKRKQPVLVGTVSIEKSEMLSDMLKKRKIPHTVLNARHHDKEAQIVAQAGRLGAVTIATNMAGRGTDIKLGGNMEFRLVEELAKCKSDEEMKAAEPKLRKKIEAEVEAEKQKVLEAGGLFIIGTERHESRRIDNQLRGRSGRQGDPGGSRFYLSLEDDLMRIFGAERMDVMLQRLGLKDGEAITHPWMSKALEKAQQKVEARNYEIRKNLLKYDDVMNDQRKVLYEQRLEVLETDDLADSIVQMRHDMVERLVAAAIPERSYADVWDVNGLTQEVFRVFSLHLPIADWAQEEGIADREIAERIILAVDGLMEMKEEKYGAAIMREAEKRVLIHALDSLWKEHLHTLDHLRQGINLRAYGQRDPLNEFKLEAFSLFETMLEQLKDVVTARLARLEVVTERMEEAPMPQVFGAASMHEHHGDFGPDDMEASEKPKTSKSRKKGSASSQTADAKDPATWGRVMRNEPCPCGSGKKYKQCHGVLA